MKVDQLLPEVRKRFGTDQAREDNRISFIDTGHQSRNQLIRLDDGLEPHKALAGRWIDPFDTRT